MLFELPDYVVNRNLVKASQRNNVCYVVALLRSCPWLQDALFYVEKDWTSIGILEQSYKPPVICLLSLFAHAMLTGSKRVMKKLIELGVDVYKHCYILNVVHNQTNLNVVCRMQELPPICLCQPSDVGFQALLECGYDVQKPISITSHTQQDQLVERTLLNYRSFWEFCLGMSKQLHVSQNLLEFTQTVLHNGYDCYSLVKYVDLCKMFVRFFGLIPGKGFRKIDDTIQAIAFLHALVNHGLCLRDKSVANNVNKAVLEVVLCPDHTAQTKLIAHHLLQTIINLSWDLTYFQKHQDSEELRLISPNTGSRKANMALFASDSTMHRHQIFRAASETAEMSFGSETINHRSQ
ncbi:hypothetical protein AHF37_06685 [Paragonimus kellicotti]|nr:hypothetical protein AHF37_06685 [Paragonimus kellicotti]